MIVRRTVYAFIERISDVSEFYAKQIETNALFTTFEEYIQQRVQIIFYKINKYKLIPWSFSLLFFHGTLPVLG